MEAVVCETNWVCWKNTDEVNCVSTFVQPLLVIMEVEKIKDIYI